MDVVGLSGRDSVRVMVNKTEIATFIVSSTLLKKTQKDESEDDESVVDDVPEADANVSDGDDDDAYDSAGEGDVSSENDA